MPTLSRPVLVILALGLLALLAFPAVADTFYLRLVTRIMVLAIFAMSLDLLVGFTGLVSLGHAAFFGVGGYVTGVMINRADVTHMLGILPVALAATAFAAVLIGWISIRTAGIYFIMITLALGQMAHFFFRDFDFWGGADGVNIASRPVLSLGETVLLDLSHRPTMYYVTLFFLVAVFVLLSVFLRAPFGRTIVGIRLNEGRMRALGYDVRHYKLAAFVIAGTIAGLAGFLEASRAVYMNPSHVGWHMSGEVLVVVLLGGMGTLFGPIIGAFALVFLEDIVAGMTDRWLLVMGLFVIAMVLFLPDGIGGLINRLAGRRRKPKEPSPEKAAGGVEVADG